MYRKQQQHHGRNLTSPHPTRFLPKASCCFKTWMPIIFLGGGGGVVWWRAPRVPFAWGPKAPWNAPDQTSPSILLPEFLADGFTHIWQLLLHLLCVVLLVNATAGVTEQKECLLFICRLVNIMFSSMFPQRKSSPWRGCMMNDALL